MDRNRTWSIDADASLQSILDSPECPLLMRQTLTSTLSWQTRNETSVRRALTSARIAPQWLAALLALRATVIIEKDDGTVEIPLQTLNQRTGEGEVSTLHIETEGVKWGQAQVARTPADAPIVAAIAAVEMDGGIVHQARIALTGVWSRPVRLADASSQLVGGPLDKASIEAVARAVEEEVAPKGDFLGSEDYRRAMACVLTRRALEECQRQETEDE
jgi:CO/xanthine dehydrogenase FAD-binding subunit